MPRKDEMLLPSEIATAFNTRRREYLTFFKGRMDRILQDEELPSGELKVELRVLTDTVLMLSTELFEMQAILVAARKAADIADNAARGQARHFSMLRDMLADLEEPSSDIREVGQPLTPEIAYEHYRVRQAEKERKA